MKRIDSCERRIAAARRRARCGGFIFSAEAILGLVLVSIVAAAVLAAARGEGRALGADGQRRTALFVAEREMDVLRVGGAMVTEAVPGVRVGVTEQKDAAAPTGYRWVSVRAECGAREVTLVGLVPRGAGVAK